MCDMSLVSILVANHNNARYIERALDSALAQTYSNIEIVVVDDASTDESLEVIESYISAHSGTTIVLYKNYTSHGCGRVKRKLVDVARGDYFAFLDPDDAIAPDAVEKLLGIHEKDKCYSIVYSTHFLCDEDLKVKGVAYWPGEIPPGQSNLTSNKGHVSAFALCKKACYDQTAGINPEYIVAEDQDLYFKMEEVAPVFFLNEPLYYYRKHGHNMSYDDKRETRNAYWLFECKKAAYLRRKKGHLTIPNIKKRDLMASCLDYHIAMAKACRKDSKPWVAVFVKVLFYTPFSFRKGFRGMKAILFINC